jgi:hypothetical protein
MLTPALPPVALLPPVAPVPPAPPRAELGGCLEGDPEQAASDNAAAQPIALIRMRFSFNGTEFIREPH